MTDNVTAKQKAENIAVLIGFPLLWVALGIVLLMKTYVFPGALFVVGAIVLVILVWRLQKAGKLNYPRDLSRKDKFWFVIAAVASIGFAVASPYIITLFSQS